MEGYSTKTYRLLKSLGVDEFTISLDFPDERHDENRGRHGLYNHLNEMIPCYVSLRANTKRKIPTFLKDSVSLYSHLREATG
jgi:MoaA/NifB/PqqE/SkfB family radical SAM enzyme